MSKSKNFVFDGGAATYLFTAIFGFLVTALTLGIGYPWAVCSFQRWKAKHTYIQGRQLVFTGGWFSLIGLWIKWMLFLILTVGIYSFWMIPSLNQWIVEHTDFADSDGTDIKEKLEFEENTEV